MELKFGLWTPGLSGFYLPGIRITGEWQHAQLKDPGFK